MELLAVITPPSFYQYASLPAPHSRLLDTQCNRPPLERRSYITWVPVWTVVSPISWAAVSRDGSDNGLSATPPPTPSCTPGTKISFAVAPGNMVPLPSSAAYTPRTSFRQQYEKIETPSQTFFGVGMESHSVK